MDTTPVERRQPHVPETSRIDVADLLLRLGQDQTLLVELCEIMLEDGPAMLAALREAVAAGDAARLRSAAHRLRGSLGVFGYRDAYQAAGDLEAFGSRGDVAAAGRILPAFAREIGLLLEDLSHLAQAVRADARSRAA